MVINDIVSPLSGPTWGRYEYRPPSAYRGERREPLWLRQLHLPSEAEALFSSFPIDIISEVLDTGSPRPEVPWATIRMTGSTCTQVFVSGRESGKEVEAAA